MWGLETSQIYANNVIYDEHLVLFPWVPEPHYISLTSGQGQEG